MSTLNKILILELLEELDKIHKLMMMLKYKIEGSITSNGSEQTLIEITEPATIYGFIDLSGMMDGDTVVIRCYVKIDPSEEFKKYDEDVYVNAQANPIVRFKPISAQYGIKVTLQQTEGVGKTFKYQFIVAKI